MQLCKCRAIRKEGEFKRNGIFIDGYSEEKRMQKLCASVDLQKSMDISCISLATMNRSYTNSRSGCKYQYQMPLKS